MTRGTCLVVHRLPQATGQSDHLRHSPLPPAPPPSSRDRSQREDSHVHGTNALHQPRGFLLLRCMAFCLGTSTTSQRSPSEAGAPDALESSETILKDPHPHPGRVGPQEQQRSRFCGSWAQHRGQEDVPPAASPPHRGPPRESSEPHLTSPVVVPAPGSMAAQTRHPIPGLWFVRKVQG